MTIRIAFFTHYADLYGANTSLLNLLDGLRPYGVAPLVIAPCSGPMTQALAQRDIPFLVVPFHWWCSEPPPAAAGVRRLLARYRVRREAIRKMGLNLTAALRLKPELEAWKVDLLYTNSSVIPLGALVGRMLNKPHIWHLREFGDLDYNLVPDWGRGLFHSLIGKSDAQVCVSQAIASHYREAVTRGKGHVVYNGVAARDRIDRLHQQARGMRDPAAPFVFSIVGLIHPNKGQEVAIRALALARQSFPNLHLVVAGTDDVGGGEVKRLQDLCASLGIEGDVSFLGYVEDPYTVYAQCDAVLMCSKNEAMGRVTVEAMTACRPLIGYDAGGTRELVENGVNGLFYRGGAEELASCMRAFLASPELARQLGENGWRCARDRFSIETYAGRIYDIACQVLHRDPADRG